MISTRTRVTIVAMITMVALAACQPTITYGTPSTREASTAAEPRNANDAPPATTATTAVTVPAGPRNGDANTTTTTAPTTTTTTAPTTTTPITTPTGWKLVGGDEFDGTSVDGSRWAPYHSNYGAGNQELECNTPGNVTESGGTLQIVARKQTVTCPGASAPMSYTSGFVGSRETGTFYPRYARFEVRAKLPHAQGLWPAFWLRHRNGAGTAEVDVMEYFHSQVPGKTTQTLHLDGVSNVSKKTTRFEDPTATPGFHTWAVEIAPDPGGVRFTFFVDDVEVHSYVDAKHAWADAAPADGTWDIALNLAVGGKWVGSPDGTLGLLEDLGRCSISGTAPGGCTTTGIRRVNWSDPASSTYAIDYVRVYTK